MARPAGNTKEKVLKSALDLMLMKGYNSTSVDDICKKAEVTKGNFFHHFKTKEDLGKSLLDYYGELIIKSLTEFEVFENYTDPLENIYKYIDFSVHLSSDITFHGSCLLGNLAQEITHTHPALKERCAGFMDKFGGIITELFENAKTIKKPKVDFDSNIAAVALISLIQGALILAKVKEDSQLFENIMLQYRSYIGSLYS